jgi:hypothetical protein
MGSLKRKQALPPEESKALKSCCVPIFNGDTRRAETGIEWACSSID